MNNGYLYSTEVKLGTNPHNTAPRDVGSVRGCGQHIGGAIVSDHTSEEIELKTCNKCGKEYPATTEYFSPDKRLRSGLRSRCKVCRAAYTAAWGTEHPEYWSAYNAAHREEQAKYHAAHREEKTKYNREYRKANPDKARANQHLRRARKRGALGKFTADDIERQRKVQKGKCYYCGKKTKLTVEHIIPLARGGTNLPENIVLACGYCNSSKGDKLPHEYGKGGRLL